MKHAFPLSPLVLSALLAGCATAPSQPTVQMRPIQNYAYLECPQISIELSAVSTWEQHHADTEAYMQKTASFMSSMDMLSGMLGAIGGQLDPSMASIYQASAQNDKLTTAQVEASQAESAAHKAGLAKRRAALEQLYAIKKC